MAPAQHLLQYQLRPPMVLLLRYPSPSYRQRIVRALQLAHRASPVRFLQRHWETCEEMRVVVAGAKAMVGCCSVGHCYMLPWCETDAAWYWVIRTCESVGAVRRRRIHFHGDDESAHKRKLDFSWLCTWQYEQNLRHSRGLGDRGCGCCCLSRVT